jgi:putative spermidine/putrescine transport system ATP-binding protein
MRGLSKSEVRTKVAGALDLVQLGHLGERRIKQLSGGQQQRVALARALVIEPKVLLLDEPLSNLDAKLRDTMRDEIRSIQQKLGITTVFVTHDQDEALATSDRIVVMSEGHIEQVGTPEQVYEHPANRFVANFIGRANIFDGKILDTAQGVATVQIDGLGPMTAVDDHRQLGQGSLMVRPHRMRITQCPSVDAHGRVGSMVYVGDSVEYSVQVADRRVTVQSVSSGEPHLPPGTPVQLSWGTRDAVVLKEEATV